MPVTIRNSDITKCRCDAMVNPTDSVFSGQGGADYAIHKTAGEKLREECRTLKPLEVGQVAVTGGYGLPAAYVFHTVGPKWQGGGHGEAMLLRVCYLNCLTEAKKRGLSSVAFPLISSGTFGFPKDRVLKLAQKAIGDFLAVTDGEMEITLCVPDAGAFEVTDGASLRRFLTGREENVCLPDMSLGLCCQSMVPDKAAVKPGRMEAPVVPDSIENWLKTKDDSFAVKLMKLIDKKGMTDVACYKRANVSRKTFSKLNTDPNYRPSKQTVLAFAIALELTLSETEALLKTVGYSLSHSSTFDMIVEYYIIRKEYDVMEINAALYQYDQVCLGC